ncbi:MAG: hypothetical protein KKB31_00700 [Nanoarchaeota archaeon]|nr:hypothetical protein [Nanoarchaeota archaeon]
MGRRKISAMKKSKLAAMEMSVGTLVTIVLLMSVMVLGIILIRSIFSSGTNAVQNIDNEVQQEIDKLFSDESKTVVLFPSSGQISLDQGESGGVGISIRNNGRGEAGDDVFGYKASYHSDDCDLGDQDYITLGKSENNIPLKSGQKLDNARLIKLRIPSDAPLCEIRYLVTVTKGGGTDPFETITFDVQIK